jgi:hypothetical protein
LTAASTPVAVGLTAVSVPVWVLMIKFGPRKGSLAIAWWKFFCRTWDHASSESPLRTLG